MSDTMTIDLNSDLGESFGAYTIGGDDELFDLISSANVACGFHGGDPRVMERTVASARDKGVAVGAHPGFLDLVGFGRRAIAATPDEVRTDVLYQLGALDAFCRAAGIELQHLKAHGALYNVAVKEPAIAGAIAEAVRAYNRDLIFLAQPGTALFAAGESAGLPTAREGFADRAYNADGTLVSRRLPGALITDPDEAAARMVRLVAEGRLQTIDGQDIELRVDSICTHSDTPGSVAIVRTMRERLEAAGVAICSLRDR
ncbi:MAG TPA: 5-oxoprolinase subunit PxpA [Thermomicrobiales bacterium]|nr:5-oxoprolinase subunit PxpA [Thermomicrobiales bacterium]